jgi:hypothetical protein
MIVPVVAGGEVLVAYQRDLLIVLFNFFIFRKKRLAKVQREMVLEVVLECLPHH